jgi:PAS domain S-box-containing protein
MAKQSLRWRLPAMISTILVVVLAAFLYSAHRELEQVLLRSGGERARNTANQVGRVIEGVTRQGLHELRRVAAAPVVREYLREPTRENEEKVRAALSKPGGLRRVSLWDARGARVLDVAKTAAEEGVPQIELPIQRQLPQAGVSPFQSIDNRVYVDSTAEVNDDPPQRGQTAKRVGWLSVRSTLRFNPPGILDQLVDRDAVVRIGSESNGVWADLSSTIASPSVALGQKPVAQYRGADGAWRVAGLSRIAGTPWTIWVEFPRETILAPERTFLRQMILLGTVFAIAGALLARTLTVRVTTPLADMTAAAEAIAAGDYSRRVPITRSDEIGRLGRVFNTMTTHVEEAYRRLEGRVEERTRELNEAMSELSRRSEAREAYLAAIVESADDAIVGQTPEGDVQSWNPGAARLYGYSAAEMIGQSVSKLVPPDGVEELEGLLKRVAHGEHIRQFETTHLKKNGKAVPVSLTISPIRDNDGLIIGVSAAARDMSDRKALEERLRQAQKMEAIGQLAGGIAHDFNNLLSGIIGYTELLRQGVNANDTRRGDLDEIAKAARRAAALTRQLLAFSRKQVLQPTVLDLNALVTDASALLKRLIGDQIRLSTKLSGDLWPVVADASQIEQIILNLAVNARDAMPEGGRLSIETSNVELDDADILHHTVARPGPYVMLAVSDTGCGMDEETRRRIFEPFFTTKGLGRGTGLGLATVYGVVQQSGGHIWVYSEPGRGAAFKVYLPRAESVGDLAAPAVQPAVVPAGSETILLVDDEAVVRSIARSLLERAGYRVLEAENARDAEAIFYEHMQEIDTLITDVIMPGSSGPALFQRLVSERANLKVLYMSGYTDDAIAHQGRLDPGVAFVEKPFSADELLRKVREVVGR